MKRALTRIINWGHELLAEVLEPGDLAVDLTAGTGQDTHFLAEAVGTEGQVVAFDLQAEALEQTTQRLQKHDFIVKSVPGHLHIYQGCHQRKSPSRYPPSHRAFLPG